MFGKAAIRLGIGPHSSLGPAFAASRVQHISDLHSEFALGTHHVSKYGRHPTSGR